jgi:hypothetical protein
MVTGSNICIALASGQQRKEVDDLLTNNNDPRADTYTFVADSSVTCV